MPPKPNNLPPLPPPPRPISREHVRNERPEDAGQSAGPSRDRPKPERQRDG